MNDAEKLIIAIEKAKKQSEEYAQDRIFVPFKEADMIITLLKEQEPKLIDYTDNPYTGLPVAHCPKCGKFARQFHTEHPGEETKFCPWCGQEVKWVSRGND